MKIFKRITAALLILCAVAGLMYASLKWDLEIDKYLYEPQNKFALWAEVMGWWPLYMGVPLAGYVLLSYAKRVKKAWQKAVFAVCGAAFAFGGAYALCIPACKYLVRRGYGFWGGAMPWLSGAVIAAAVIIAAAVTKPHRGMLVRLRTFAIISVGFIAVENIVINILKSVWNRSRFDNMVANGTLDRFTSWITVPGNGGTSFPSGHTASAASILLCVFFCLLFEECKNEEGKFVFVGTVYTAAVAVGRLIIGRHFLSDTVAAYFIVGLLIAIAYWFPPLRKWVLKSAATAKSLDEYDGVFPNPEYLAPQAERKTVKKQDAKLKEEKIERKKAPSENKKVYKKGDD